MKTKGITYSAAFRKHYSARISGNRSLVGDFRQAVVAFNEDPFDPSLRNHALTDSMTHYRAFSINQDYRVIYRESPVSFVFLDVGTHKQVYRR